MSQSFAIVGSGPSGFYAAEALIKDRTDVFVDVIDRLPTPYGLVRSGVAPDHQGIKQVWRVFQRTAKRPQIRFLGNVELGRDVTLAELREAYDGVILAIGAPVDRELGVPGEDLPGVIGSGQFTSWYNGHPDRAGQEPDLGEPHPEHGGAVAVIGNGNVAIDVARVLCRRGHEMTKTDLPGYAVDRIARAQIRDVYMIGRRGPSEASFTPAELRELEDLAETVVVCDAAQIPSEVHHSDPKEQKAKERIVEQLRVYATHDPASKPTRLHLIFCAAPERVLGSARVEGVRLMKNRIEGSKAVATGETFDLRVGAVIKAIGYYAKPIEGLELPARATHYPNVNGRIDQGLWAVGWAKRGPTGVIATNRGDSIEVVARLLAETPADGKPGAREKIDAILATRGTKVVSFADWEKIEKVEDEAGKERGAPRVKVTDWRELVRIAQS